MESHLFITCHLVITKMNHNSLGYRTLRGMLWGYIGKLSEFALAFVFSIIVARTLGPAIYGHYNLFISIIATLLLFSSLGFDAILNKFIPQLKTEGRMAAAFLLFHKIFWGRFLIISVLGVIVWINSPFLTTFFADEVFYRYSLLFVLLLLGRGIQDLLIAFLNALLKLKEITIVYALSQLLGIAIMVILFMYSGLSLKAVLQAVFFSTALSIALFLFLSMKLSAGHAEGYVYNLKPYLRFGLSVWQITLLTYAVSATLNVLLMGRILKDPLQIGFYSTAVLFSYLPGNLVGSWAKIILPVMSETKMRYGLDGVSEAFVGFSKVIFIMLIPTLLFLGRYANIMVLSLFGEKFIPSVLLIQVYVFFALIALMAVPHLGVNTLYALDKEKLVLRIRFIAGGLNIALVLLLISLFKALGVMIAGSIAVTFQTIAEFLAVRRYVPMKYPLGYLFKITISGMGGLLLFAWFPVKNLTAVIIVGVLYLVTLFIIFHFIRLLTPEDKKFLSRMHPALAAIVKYF